MTKPQRHRGPPPLTIDEMQAIAARRGGKCLSTEYVNANTRLEWECAEGHRWLAIPNSVKRGTWCKTCARQGTRLSLADIQRIATRHGGRCLSEAYVNGKTPMQFECAAGHRWQANGAAIRAGHWCAQCVHAGRRATIEEMREIAAGRGGQCLSETYVNQRQPLRWRCASGHEWESKASIVRQHWCPHCQHERRRTGLARMQEIAASHGGRCLADVYVNAHARLAWQCAKGHVWQMTASKAQIGRWCPVCSGHRRYTLADMQMLARARGGDCLSAAYVSVHRKLHWICARGHAWSATPSGVLHGHWCPQCAILDRCVHEAAKLKYLAVAVPGGAR